MNNKCSYANSEIGISTIEKEIDKFVYCSETGSLRKMVCGSLRLLKSKDQDGYIRSAVNGKYFYAHRLAWRLHFGYWPDGIIDHINGDKTDNRINNLRVVTQKENQRNRFATTGASKFKGVTLHKKLNKWQAQLGKEGKTFYLGIFESQEEAAAAYDAAARQHFGKFAQVNFAEVQS